MFPRLPRLREGKQYLVLVGLLAIFQTLAETSLAAQIQGQRPSVQITQGPAPWDSVFYSVLIQWSGSDPDGFVDHYVYVIDPPACCDTTWIQIKNTSFSHLYTCKYPESILPTTGPYAMSSFHVFALKAVDDEGLESAPAYRPFTSYTVAPEGQIIMPVPDADNPVATGTSVHVEWSGEDLDGVQTQSPVDYRVKLAAAAEILGTATLAGADPTAEQIQQFFSSSAPDFTGWDSVDPNSAVFDLMGLQDLTDYYFAVTAIDEASAYDPRFSVGRNVLWLRVDQNIPVQATTWGRIKDGLR